MLGFTIPILKISASGGWYLQTTLLKPPQKWALTSPKYWDPFALHNREVQKAKGRKLDGKRKRDADKEEPVMSFSLFCPSCATQTADFKYTFHAVCQQLLFHPAFCIRGKLYSHLSQSKKQSWEQAIQLPLAFKSIPVCSANTCLGKTPFQALKRWREPQAAGLSVFPLPSQMLPCGACTSHLPGPSHSLPRALMDIKNRTNQAWDGNKIHAQPAWTAVVILL